MTEPQSESGEFLEQMRTLALSALAAWELDVAGITPLKVRENAVFRLDFKDGGRAVLRVHRAGYHTDEELGSEFTWLSALDAAGVAVPRVIRSRRGRDFEVVATAEVGARQIDIFEWISGDQLGSVETGIGAEEGMVAHRYHTIGAIAARMHNQSVGWQRPTWFRRHAWDAPGLVGEQPFWGRFWELAALSTGQRELLGRARARIAEGLGDYGMKADNYGLIHADLVPENLLVDGDQVRVIDFDDAGFGWHLFELATSLYFITGESIYPAARAALIRGYRSERPLSEQAVGMLPLFLAARGTTYLGWVHTRQGSDTARDFTPFLVERACDMAERCLG
jgi:Ser/Thr protein kinase RdoA (MazF antagonist)